MQAVQPRESDPETVAYQSEPGTEILTLDLREQPRPTAAEIGVLASFERFAFGLCTRMNAGHWKRFWTWCQSVVGAGWIHISTYNLMNVYGFENIEAADHEKPILIVA